MNKIRTLKPGQPGTKNLYDFYGDKLLCVRYRYNYEKMECIKTVELVIETKKMKIRKFKHHPKKIVNIIVRYGEAHLGRLVRQAGGDALDLRVMSCDIKSDSRAEVPRCLYGFPVAILGRVCRYA